MNFDLLDPDAFLEKTLFLVRPFFSRAGLIFWAAILFFALVQAGIHWRELTSNVTDQVLSLRNLFILGLIYPVTRVFHEFGHAYAVKRWGGEVHEMGVMLIAFMPIPYMDASSSSVFHQKSRRIMVSAAGIMVDLLLAACGVIVWINAEPGMARVIAYNVILIGGVSTLLLNGNPLLRFDAYYILADFLEIPNLADRGNKYIGYLLQRYLFGIREARSPAQATGEEIWFFLYAVASFCYRILISISIVLFIAGRFFLLGVILAIWTASAILILPLVRFGRHVHQNMRRSLPRILLVAGGFAGLAAIVLFLMPFPSFTVSEGVVRAPEESQIFAGTDGFVVKIIASPGSRVLKGEPIYFCEDPELRAELNVLRAGLRELEARYRLSFVTNITEAQVLRERMTSAMAKLARAEERFGEMVVRSPAGGILLMPKADDLPGSFVHKGMPMGYVVDFSKTVVRVVVNQADVDHIRYRTRKVEGRFAASVNNLYPARIEREVPGASNELPSMSLSLEGGGDVVLDPRETQKPKSFEKLFHFDIALDSAKARGIGERVYVRFEHDQEPLAFRLHRSIRRLLLNKFGI
jgi:putative peptide zinc metalloprotease protein